jgi:hypothetical protein
MRRPQQLPDPIPSLGEFEGIINTRRKKDFGYGGLTVAYNVEVTNTKRLVRRNGYEAFADGAYTALYGSINQKLLLAVIGGELQHIDANGDALVLTTGLLDGTYSWDEDPASNIFYTSDSGSNGIVSYEGIWFPLSLAVPVITQISAVETASWTVTPFNLGKKYTENVMQLFATYLYPDGRESAPSDVVTLPIAPEVKLLQAQIPVQSGCTTCVYATAPGGSTYWLVGQSTNPTFTFRVYMLTQSYTGTDYPYTTVLGSFPSEASVIAHYAGRLYAGVYDPEIALGAVYASLPLQYHLFNRAEDVFQVSGAPLLLLACTEGLIVGTEDMIYLWQEPQLRDHQAGAKGTLKTLANYGVPPGVCGDVAMDGIAYFWTQRGVAKAMPYELVTEQRFSGDPGVFNNAKILYERGYAKLLASTIAGAPAFNKWQERS